MVEKGWKQEARLMELDQIYGGEMGREDKNRRGVPQGPRDWVEFCCSPEWIAVTIQQHHRNKRVNPWGAQSPLTWDAVEGGASFCQIEVNKGGVEPVGFPFLFLSSKTMNFNNPFSFLSIKS